MNLTKNHDVTEYWVGIHMGMNGHSVYSSDNSRITWSHLRPLDKVEGSECGKVCTAVCFCEAMAPWKDKCCSLKMHSVCDKHIGKPSFHILKMCWCRNFSGYNLEKKD